jgi:hypothetical protein
MKEVVFSLDLRLYIVNLLCRKRKIERKRGVAVVLRRSEVDLVERAGFDGNVELGGRRRRWWW